MSSKRLNLLLLAVIGLMFLGLLAGAYGINSLLGREAVKLTDLKAKSQALESGQISLIKSKQDVAKYADLEKIARAVVPEDKSQAEAVRQIVNIAAANNISLASITFPASTLGDGIAKPGAAASPAPAAGAGSKSLSQLQPVPNISGVYLLTITVTSDSNEPVEYNRFISFLQDLESNRRTAQVSSISLEPNVKNRNLLSFTLTLNNYIKP